MTYRIKMFNNSSSIIPVVDVSDPHIEPHLALRVCMAIIAVVAILSNGLLAVVFLHNRTLLRSSYNVLILSLAITDMTTGVGLILTPAYVVGIKKFPIPGGIAGDLFCRIVASYYLVFTLGIVSVYTITCLSLERWFAVAKPAKYRAGFKSYRIYVIVMVVWVVSFLFNAPHLFEMELGPSNECVWTAVTEGDTRKVVALIEFLGKFFLPLLITCFSFLSLWRKVRDSPALFKTNKGKAGVRLLRMCALIAILLAFCWFPNQVYYLLFKFDITKMDTAAHQVTVVLCMGNSTLNPFIYCATNSVYRKQFLRLFGLKNRDYSVDDPSSNAKKANKSTSSSSDQLAQKKVKNFSQDQYEECYARTVDELQV